MNSDSDVSISKFQFRASIQPCLKICIRKFICCFSNVCIHILIISISNAIIDRYIGAPVPRRQQTTRSAEFCCREQRKIVKHSIMKRTKKRFLKTQKKTAASTYILFFLLCLPRLKETSIQIKSK